jgi:hypothetical protein
VANKPSQAKPVPTFEHDEADGIHTYHFPDAPIPEVSITIEHPEYDRYRRLVATVTACMGTVEANPATINLLDQNKRVDFEKVASTFDGDVPWHDYLLAIVPHLRKHLRAQTAATDDPPAVRGIKVKTLLSRTFDDPRAVVEGVLMEGLHVFAGKPKLGKSRLMLALAVSVATESPALGIAPVSPGEVLYLSLEDPERRLQRRFVSLLADAECPETLEYETQWPRLNEGGIEALKTWIAEHPNARLIVVDTLKRIKAKGVQGRNAYDEDYESLQTLQDLVNLRPGLAIVVIHHTNKRIDAEDVADLISGSTGLPAGADGFLILRRQRGTADASLTVVHRDLDDDKELALKSDQETGGWRLLGTAAEYLVSEERRAIIDCLKHSVKALRPIDIARAIGRDTDKGRGALRVLLHRMCLSGELTSPRYGYYTHSNTGNTDNTGNTGNTGNTSSTDAGFEPPEGANAERRSGGVGRKSVTDPDHTGNTSAHPATDGDHQGESDRKSVTPPQPCNTSSNTLSAGKDRASQESVTGVTGVTHHNLRPCPTCGGRDLEMMNGRLICMSCLIAGKGIGEVSSREGGPRPQKKWQCRCGQWVTPKATGRPGRFCSASCRSRAWREMREQL